MRGRSSFLKRAVGIAVSPLPFARPPLAPRPGGGVGHAHSRQIALLFNNRSAQFKLDNPELSHKQITSKISETWNSFGPDDKAAYEEKAGEAKAAYAIYAN